MSDVRQQHSPIAQLRTDLKLALPTFGLSGQKEQDRMSSVLMVAVEKDPQLVFADRQSLIAAVRQCANHGLVPDGNEATLQVYNTKVKDQAGNEKWIKKVQYQPMVRGIITRVLRSGKVLSFWAECVYEGEPFRIDISHGDRRPIHDPDHFNRTGKVIGVYAVAKMATGAVDCEPMNAAQLEQVRAVAKTQKVWDLWFDEKAKVAVMRRLSKRLPLSAEDMDFIMNREEHDLEARDVSPKESTEERLRRVSQEKQVVDEAAAEPEGVIEGEIVLEYLEDDVFPGSDEFTEGVKASQKGKPASDNPYTDNPDYSNWHGGWCQAEENKEQ